MWAKVSSSQNHLAIYTKDTLPVQSLDIKVPPSLECLWLQVTSTYFSREVSTLVIGAVYHPPGVASESDLIDHISHTITHVKNKHLHCGIIVCGDFNKADILLLRSRNLKQIVDVTTRGNSVLDLIISDLSTFYKPAEILSPIGKSDHSCVLCRPDLHGRIRPTSQTRLSRPMPESAIHTFGQWITAYNWKPVLDCSSAQEKADHLYDIAQEQINRHFPLKKVTSQSNDKPWMNNKSSPLFRTGNRHLGKEKDFGGGN